MLLGFFLWDYAKDHVYSSKVNDLHHRIMAVVATVTFQMLQNTCREMGYGLGVCRASEGASVGISFICKSGQLFNHKVL